MAFFANFLHKRVSFLELTPFYAHAFFRASLFTHTPFHAYGHTSSKVHALLSARHLEHILFLLLFQALPAEITELNDADAQW